MGSWLGRLYGDGTQRQEPAVSGSKTPSRPARTGAHITLALLAGAAALVVGWIVAAPRDAPPRALVPPRGPSTASEAVAEAALPAPWRKAAATRKNKVSAKKKSKARNQVAPQPRQEAPPPVALQAGAVAGRARVAKAAALALVDILRREGLAFRLKLGAVLGAVLMLVGFVLSGVWRGLRKPDISHITDKDRSSRYRRD